MHLDPMGHLINYFDTILPLDDSEKQFVRDQLEVQQVKKGELLLKEGDVSDAFYFTVQGFFRMFYTRDIEEFTTYFYRENDFISAYESYIRQVPARMNIQAMEASVVIAISQISAFKLLEFSPKFDALARIIMEEENIIAQTIIASLLSMSPEERYEKLLDENPDVFQRVPQHYIASYIGIKPESLSRIKRRMQKS